MLHDSLDLPELAQGFAAEEHDIDPLARPGFRKQQVDGPDCRLEIHVLAPNWGCKVLLVTITAGEIAARRHVEDDGTQGKFLDPWQGGGPLRSPATADDAKRLELLDH